jgi:sialidase-1
VIVADPTGRVCPSTWLLASGCASTSLRANLTVWLSKDNGVTWSEGWQCYAGGAAYSTLVALPNGRFAILWENTDASVLAYTTFSLSVFA